MTKTNTVRGARKNPVSTLLDLQAGVHARAVADPGEPSLDQTVERIAREVLGFETLTTQKSGADFKEVAVWTVRQALEQAFRAGFEAGRS